MTDKLLMVEDDEGLRKQLGWCFQDYKLVAADDRPSAIASLRRHEPAVVLLDLGLPPEAEGVGEGFRALQEILQLAPCTKVIVVTGHGDHDNAVRAVGMGAYDFYQKPIEVDTLSLLVKRAFHLYELEAENRRLADQSGSSLFSGIVAGSESMMQVCRRVEKVAPTNATTLLLGESGTGKELMARTLHELSPRKDRPFVAINCAAIPENLLESELFGFERGAFTGAHKQTPGRIETADTGTLFLDEIGDMPLLLQAKLLRFLQERVVQRLGGRSETPVDVRMVCATNQDLQAAMRDGRFREDLYYRISAITIELPPLRDRGEGKIVLARSLLARVAREMKRRVPSLGEDTQAAIQQYEWPGNVRELENRLRNALIMAEGKHITASDLGLVAGEEPALNLREARERVERRTIREALARTGGNVSRAAELLGVTRPTLYDLMAKCGISSADLATPSDPAGTG